jgi:hypothetical protein
MGSHRFRFPTGVREAAATANMSTEAGRGAGLLARALRHDRDRDGDARVVAAVKVVAVVESDVDVVGVVPVVSPGLGVRIDDQEREAAVPEPRVALVDHRLFAEAERMLPSEASVEAIPRDVPAAVAATLRPGSVLVLPVVGAMPLPVLVPLPATLTLPAALLVPGPRVARAPLLHGVRARRGSAPRLPALGLLHLLRLTLGRTAPALLLSALGLLHLLRLTLRRTAPALWLPVLGLLHLRWLTLGRAAPALSLPALLWRMLLWWRRRRLLPAPSLPALLRWRSATVLVLRGGRGRRANDRQQRGRSCQRHTDTGRARSRCVHHLT